ncbi:hypothetical protein SNEBB_004444 [Seison nebaliae]|nr:hypothetical protein SNEBB_004444 [Seison nebaliae]
MVEENGKIGNDSKKFGNRYLINEQDLFNENAWDDYEWTEEELNEASNKINNQRTNLMSNDKSMELLSKPEKYWNEFYSKHNNKFFKNRRWLQHELPELFSRIEHERLNILEVGCGVGNMLRPLFDLNKLNNETKFFCIDHAPEAVKILKDDLRTNKYYQQIETLTFDIRQIGKEKNEFNKKFGNIQFDYIFLVFTLSAIHPQHHFLILNELSKILSRNGIIFFRDYSFRDLTQLRMKNGKCINSNLYSRGDGTLVHFFEKDKFENIIQQTNKLVIKQLNIDSRLLVNRKNNIKMKRLWLQGKMMKKNELNSPQ